MAVTSVIVVAVAFTTVMQINATYLDKFYASHDALESALTTKKMLYILRQIFFPVEHIYGQEIQQVRFHVCVEITVDSAMNTSMNICATHDRELSETHNDSADGNTLSWCWNFLWSDSSLVSLITLDQLRVFENIFFALCEYTATGDFIYQRAEASLSIVCPVVPDKADIKTSLMLLLSWSKAYVRYQAPPPQWDESDKGYIQETYDGRGLLTESSYIESENVHYIRLVLVISFALLNILVLIVVLSNGKQCYENLYQNMSSSNRLAALAWALMITVLIVNSVYLACTIISYLSSNKKYDSGLWLCLTSPESWCSSYKSTFLYSDELFSLLVKFIVVPIAIVAELVASIRLTHHTLLPMPCTVEGRSLCLPVRIANIGNRVIQTIFIWNVMVFIQIILGLALLPVCVFMVIAPGATLSALSFISLVVIFLTGCITYFILKWCNPISFKQCLSVSFWVNIFISTATFSLISGILFVYYTIIYLGVKPWSVKGSILSLLPSLLITPLLWFVKKFFFKKNSTGRNKNNGVSAMTYEFHNIMETSFEEEEAEEPNEAR